MIIARVVTLLGLAVIVQAIGEYSVNGCYQEANEAFGDYGKGLIGSDLVILNSLSASHRLFELRTCVDTTGTLKGLQVMAAVYTESGVTEKIRLTQFGDLAPPSCKVDTFGDAEFVSNFTFYYSKNKLEGISYVTSTGSTQNLGKTKTTDWFNPISSKSFSTTREYEFIGFFGSYSVETVYSLGAIRMRMDC